MNEIDLIPNFYREHVYKLRILKLFALILIVLLLTSGVAYGALEYVKRDTQSEIDQLSKIKEITSQQREEIRLLNHEKDQLDSQWALLNGLRTAVAAEDLFIAIDRSLQNVDVWFSSIKFQRNEIEVKEKSTVNTGYFIIVTPNGEDNNLAIGTNMLIIGKAINHSALSSFVNNLIDQYEILDAKVLETKSDKSNKSNVVEFNLSITVNLEREKV